MRLSIWTGPINFRPLRHQFVTPEQRIPCPCPCLCLSLLTQCHFHAHSSLRLNSSSSRLEQFAWPVAHFCLALDFKTSQHKSRATARRGERDNKNINAKMRKMKIDAKSGYKLCLRWHWRRRWRWRWHCRRLFWPAKLIEIASLIKQN